MEQPMATSPFTHYTEAGNGAPVIFIHGVGLDGTIWKQQVEALSKAYRVICYDMIGHGQSACPAGPYTLAQFVKQLEDLYEELELDQAHVVGFSMGGLVAQGFAALHPEKVSTLTIVSSVAKRTEEQRRAVLARVREVEQRGHQATIEAAIQRWFSPAYMAKHPQVIESIRHRLRANHPDAYLAAYRVFAAADEELYQQLPLISCPAWIVTGELDRGSTPEMAELMAKRIPKAEVTVLPGIRHMLPIEAAERFNQLLISAFEKYEGEVRRNG
ncbi:alpha/beta hydrolase [Brevibacillus humidisoli]|uniref:alpha/beta fold hydrolase n=1 Tax=Brevibacillus humidisoli TaxID=2895522 RepID=UPI001E647508|nr:alpha/beta fold hydrolase [Brevibacillus humidisoli]UFJ40896.1 alpha/beta hydrolase [Brevibacillus humidisoli]